MMTIEKLVWWIGGLTAVSFVGFLLLLAMTVLFVRGIREITALIRLVKAFLEVAEWQRKKSRDKFAGLMGDKMKVEAKAGVKEGMREALTDLTPHDFPPSPSDSGDRLATIPPLPAGGVVIAIPPDPPVKGSD